MRTWKGKFFTVLAAAGLVLLVVAAPAAAAYAYPSTNALNATQQTPGYLGQPTPYVEQVGVGPGTVTLHFVNESVALAYFEIRTDGVLVTSGTRHGFLYTYQGLDEWEYPGVCVQGPNPIFQNYCVGSGNEQTRTFSANEKVEVRMALGSENDFYFDWVTFPIGPGTLVPTTGTWAQYPVGAPVYQAQVQQPINSANTSNWSSKSRGGIPVMFQLLEGTGPAAFESILSDDPTENDWAAVAFTPDQPLTFADIGLLKTDYSFTLGDCHGGSLRWSVETAVGNLFIYYGEAPNFTDCTTNSQSGVNMIGFSDLRYDTSQVGGTFYDTYAHALELIGDEPVLAVDLVLDGGWSGDQRATIGNTTVNDTSYDFVSAASAPAPTCDMPEAFIDVTKVNPAASGSINEATVYPASATDTSDQFRVIDCKYQYILSIPSLDGVGQYDVEILIGGNEVDTVPNNEVMFDLK